MSRAHRPISSGFDAPVRRARTDIRKLQPPTRLRTVDKGTLWDGISLEEAFTVPNGLMVFCSGTHAVALQNFLQQRAAYLDYVSRDLRLCIKDNKSGSKARIQSVLLGTTTFPGADPDSNTDIFDLFDVVDFDFPEAAVPVSKLLINANPSILKEEKNG